MPDVFHFYLELSIYLPTDIARYVVENFIRRKNIKVIEKCCRIYNHYTDVINLSKYINYSRTIRIQIILENITLIIHNVNEKSYRVDAIIHKKNTNVYIINFKDSYDVKKDKEIKRARDIIKDVKGGVFDDYPLMKALSLQIE